MVKESCEIEKKEKEIWNRYIGKLLSVKEALGITGKVNPIKHLKEHLEEDNEDYKKLTKSKKEKVLQQLDSYIKRKTNCK